MSKDKSFLSHDINKLIISKLEVYPDEVANLSIRAIELAETLPVATIVETLQSQVRDVIRKQVGSS